MERKPYPSDLTDAQWELVEPHIPPERWGGRTRSVDVRAVLNGILYLTRTGCQWRAIPDDLPNWNAVRHYYDRFRRDGTWHRVHDALRASGCASARARSRPRPPPPSSTASR